MFLLPMAVATAAQQPDLGDQDRRRRHDLFIIRLLFIFFYFGMGIYIVYLNPYLRSIGLTGVQIGTIASLSPLVVTIVNPVWGLISDKLGRARTLLIVAPFVTMLAAFGLSIARSFVVILLIEICFAAFFLPVNSLVSSLTVQILDKEPEKFGEFRVWGSIGFIITAFTFGFILERTGLGFMFYGYMATAFMFLIAVFFLHKQEINGKGQQPVFQALATLMRQRNWLMFTISMIMVSTGVAAMNAFLGVYLIDLGAGSQLIGSVQSLAAFSEIPILFLGAMLIKRFGARRLLILAYTVWAVRWAFYGLMPSPGWALVIAPLHSISFGVFLIAGVDYANSLAPPDLKATTQGLFYASWSLANFIGSPITGFLYDTFGGGTTYLVYSCVGFVALLVLALGTTAPRVAGAPVPGPALGLTGRRGLSVALSLAAVGLVTCMIGGTGGLVFLSATGNMPAALAASLRPDLGRAAEPQALITPFGGALLEPTAYLPAAQTPVVQVTLPPQLGLQPTATFQPPLPQVAEPVNPPAGPVPTLTPFILTDAEGIIMGGIPMVYVPGTGDALLPAYYLDKAPVSGQEWARCSSAGACSGDLQSTGQAGWAVYCAWRGLRLPSAQEIALAAAIQAIPSASDAPRCAVNASQVSP